MTHDPKPLAPHVRNASAPKWPLVSAIVVVLAAGIGVAIHALRPVAVTERPGRVSPEQQFIAAAGAGDLDTVRRLLEAGVPIDYNDGPLGVHRANGTALLHAVRRGEIEVAAFLLERGADVTVRMPSGDDVLEAAMSTWTPEMVRLVLAHGADPEGTIRQVVDGPALARYVRGGYANHEAIDAMLVVLLEHGANVNAGSRWTTALGCAARSHRVDAVNILLQYGADVNAAPAPNDDCAHPLPALLAMLEPFLFQSSLTILGILIDAGADLEAVDAKGRTALLKAVELRRPDLVDRLLVAGANATHVDHQGRDAFSLARAIDDSHAEVRDLLMRMLVLAMLADNPVIEDISPSEAAELLKGRGVDPAAADALLSGDGVEADTAHPLHAAAVAGNEERVAALLASDGDADVLNEKDRTPLEAMCSLLVPRHRAHARIAQLLIDAGADPDRADAAGVAPLAAAAARHDAELAAVLLDAGAVIDRVSGGQTPLTWAVANGATEVVTLLLERGADVNAAGTDGWTALHQAAATGRLDTVRLLIDAGADRTRRHATHGTPADVARDRGHDAVVRWLDGHAGSRSPE